MKSQNVLQLVIRPCFASMRAVLLVEGHDILELFRFLKLLSEKCFQELIFGQGSDVQGHVVPIILELLEVVPL